MDDCDETMEQVIAQLREINERAATRSHEYDDFVISIHDSRKEFDLKIKAIKELRDK